MRIAFDLRAIKPGGEPASRSATERRAVRRDQCLDPRRLPGSVRIRKEVGRKVPEKSASEIHVHVSRLRDESAELAERAAVYQHQNALRIREYRVERIGPRARIAGRVWHE